LASCKWRVEWTKIGDLNDLCRTAARVGATEETPVVLFSRSGFDPALVARAQTERVILITPADMLDPALIDRTP
jgi:hypothetical protein